MKETILSETQPRTPRDLLETLFRHKKKMIVFFLAVTVSTLAVLAFTPATYTSTSKLIVHPGRESVFVDPTAGGATPLYKEWESEINSELEILNSRELVTQVVEALGSAAFLEEPPGQTGGKLGGIRKMLDPVRLSTRNFFKKWAREKPDKKTDKPQKQLDSIIQAVEKSLAIGVRPKSDIITVSYTAASPQLARQVVTALINQYLELRISLHQIPGGYEFFSQQTDMLLGELEKNGERILAIKKEAGVDSLNDNQLAMQTAVEQMRVEQLRVQSEMAAAKARVDTIQFMLTQQSSAERTLKNSSILDPIEYKALQSTLRLEDATLAALVAKDKEISRQITQLQSKLIEIEVLQNPIRRLQREQEILEDKYRKYSEHREQARINQELETRKIFNVTIVQHATLSDEANPSGKMIKLAASLFLGLLGAMAIAFGSDYIDPTLHSATDIADRLKRPTLIELPCLQNKELDPAYKTPPRKERRNLHILHSGKPSYRDEELCFQELCFRLLALRPPHKKDPLIIGLTSSTGGEGVSTIAGKLAAAFSYDGRFPNVLLLDANPTEHSHQLVKQRTDLPFAFRQFREMAETVPEMPSMDACAVIQYLDRARQEDYDMIVIDIPPLNEGGYAVRVAAEADIVGFVVDCGRTPWRIVKRAVDLLDHAEAHLSGIILNRQQYMMPKWLYKKL
jgi:uncharacterized protein involved in exopolysaccharide biosynthesis/Mrp family chromosome partitioning ATPase